MLNNSIKIGATPTIGSHILPGEPLIELSKIIEGQIKLSILNTRKVIKGVKEGEFDLGLIESAVFDNMLIYKKWIRDELVVCSKTPLGESIDIETISHCQLLCRREISPTRQLISNFLREQALSYHHFDSLMEIDNCTSAIQGIKWSRPNRENPTIAIVSKLAVEDEVKRKELYLSRIGGASIERYFYIIYRKEESNNEQISKVINYLLSSQQMPEPSSAMQ